MPIPDSALTPPLLSALKLLIRANHILHQHALVDAFGHISIRHPLEPSRYIIAAYDPGAPALVSSRRDFIVYHVNHSTPVHPGQPQGNSERFIHGELFKMIPEAMCVVHSHSEAVIPFTSTYGVDVKPIFHMAGFLGHRGLRVFDPSQEFGQVPQQQGLQYISTSSSSHEPYDADMLVKNSTLGAALAAHFIDGPPVVLQTKHGFTCWGASIEQAIYRAIYTQKNCELLQKALTLSNVDAGRVGFLTEEEVKGCALMNVKCQDKAWRLWLREVQVSSLYENEEGEPEAVAVGGMKQ